MFILCSANVNGTAVSTLARAAYNTGVERLLTGAAGNYQAEFVHVARQIPRVTFDTRLITALEAVALGNGNVIFRQVAEGGVGNSTYKSLTGTNSYVLHVPRRISWQAGGPATLSAEMIFLSSNGSTAPITVGTTTGDLTAETLQWAGDDELTSSIEIDFGFNISLPQDGKLYQKHAFVVEQRPMISITSYDESLITTARANPGAIATLTATLAAVADGGIRGTQRSYSVTGHVLADVEGAKPGTVRLTCAGKGGLTIA